MRKIIILMFFIFLNSNINTFAHPGNTDASGGHHCWTNCSQWELEYGEYHYHNSNSQNTPTVEAPQPIVHTYQEGYDEAYEYWYNQVLSDLKQKSSKSWEAEWTDYSREYSSGYKDGFDKAVSDATIAYQKYEYDRGYAEGKKDANRGNKALIGNDAYEVAKTEPDYLKGYTEGYNNEMEIIEKSLTDKKESIEIPDKFKERSDSFILGYQNGFFHSQGDYMYDDYSKEEDSEEYILGYKNGWNDEGGSLPILTQLELLYLNHIKGYEAIALLPTLGVLGFLIGKRKRKIG